MKEIDVYLGLGIASYLFGITRAIVRSKKRWWTVFFMIVGLLGTLAVLFVVGLIWPYQNGSALPEDAIIGGLLVSLFAGLRHMMSTLGLGL